MQNQVLNIFTDASMLKTYGSAGYVAYVGSEPTPIDMGYTLISNCTNNIAEIYAVMMGVLFAIRHKQEFPIIRLFSDSQWSVNSLTKWMFTWIYSIDQNGTMYNSSGQPVKNQIFFENIIHLILSEDLKIQICHCKGHVTDTYASIYNAQAVFRRSNSQYKGNNSNRDFIRWVSDGNNFIDQFTRSQLMNKSFVQLDKESIPAEALTPIRFMLNPEIISAYKAHLW